MSIDHIEILSSYNRKAQDAERLQTAQLKQAEGARDTRDFNLRQDWQVADRALEQSEAQELQTCEAGYQALLAAPAAVRDEKTKRASQKLSTTYWAIQYQVQYATEQSKGSQTFNSSYLERDAHVIAALETVEANLEFKAATKLVTEQHQRLCADISSAYAQRCSAARAELQQKLRASQAEYNSLCEKIRRDYATARATRMNQWLDGMDRQSVAYAEGHKH